MLTLRFLHWCSEFRQNCRRDGARRWCAPFAVAMALGMPMMAAVGMAVGIGCKRLSAELPTVMLTTVADVPVTVDLAVELGVSVVTGVSSAAHGTVTVSEAVVVYSPDAGFVGADSFSYVADRQSYGVIVVTVEAAPILEPWPDVAASTPLHVPVTIDLQLEAGIGGALDAISQPSHGTAEIVGGTANVVYSPGLGFVGTDAFTFEAEGRVGTVTVTVTPVPATVLVVQGPTDLDAFTGDDVRFELLIVDADTGGLSVTPLNPPPGMDWAPITDRLSPLAVPVVWRVPKTAGGVHVVSFRITSAGTNGPGSAETATHTVTIQIYAGE